MLRIRVSTASAEITETELITAGRVGLQCAFEFNDAWDGLAKTVVIHGGVKRDIVLVGDTITVPGECLAREQFPLRIGVYGANGAGEIVIPTIWANFGKILPSARPSGIGPDEVTPDVVAQINRNSSDALRLAQEVMRRADSGEFDGRDGATGQQGPVGPTGNPGEDGISPVVTVTAITGGHRVTITDARGARSFDVMNGERGPAGVGFPAGGHQHDVLRKLSDTDYDTQWANPMDLLSAEVKEALLQLAQKVAYIDAQGQSYYNALYNAMYPPKELLYITAIYTQSGTVYDDASLDSLKDDLLVKAKYDDNTEPYLTGYTLSGTLTAGTSTVTVTYNGKTTTFTVTVTARPTLSSISAVYTQSGTVYDTDTLDSLKDDLVVTAHYSDSSTATVAAADYTLSGTLAEGTSTITVSYQGKTTTFSVTVSDEPLVPSEYQQVEYAERPSSAAIQNFIITEVVPTGTGTLEFDVEFMATSETGVKYPVGINVPGENTIGFGVGMAADGKSYYSFAGGDTASITSDSSLLNQKINAHATVDSSGWTISDGTTTATATGTPRNYKNRICLYGVRKNNLSQASFTMVGRIYYFKVAENNVVLGEFIPCKRISDDAVGFYDRINETFVSSSVLVAGPAVGGE